LDRAAFDEALFRLFGQHLINCLLHPHAKIHAVRRKVSGGETYRHYLPS
jgi:primosomal protein N''